MVILSTSSASDNHFRNFCSILASFQHDLAEGKLNAFSADQLSRRLNTAYLEAFCSWRKSMRAHHIQVQIHEWFSRSVQIGEFVLTLRFCRVRFPQFHTTTRVLPSAFLPFSSFLCSDAALILHGRVQYSSSGLSDNLFCPLIPEEARHAQNHLLQMLHFNRWLAEFLKSSVSYLSDIPFFYRFRRFYYGKRKLWLIISHPFRTAPTRKDFLSVSF